MRAERVEGCGWVSILGIENPLGRVRVREMMRS